MKKGGSVKTTKPLSLKLFALYLEHFLAVVPEPSTQFFLVCLLDDIKYLVDAYDISSNTETVQLKYFSALNL